MLSQGKTMEIAELYDLTHSYTTTAQLAGVDPKTVKRALARRAAGRSEEGPQSRIVTKHQENGRSDLFALVRLVVLNRSPFDNACVAKGNYATPPPPVRCREHHARCRSHYRPLSGLRTAHLSP